MKDVLRELNQRPIAYYPIYGEITGSTTAGILLSQLMYWFAKQDKFFKTDSDIIAETRLTVNELRSAKKALKDVGFVKISREGVPARTFYEIDWELYEKTFQDRTKKAQTSSVNSTKQDELNQQNKMSEINDNRLVKFTKQDELNSQIPYYNAEITTEITTETTTEKEKNKKEKSQKLEIDLPAFLNPEVWSDFLAYRKERKEKITLTGIKRKFSQWQKWHDEGIDVNQCIIETMANDWQGVFKPKAQQNNQGYKQQNNQVEVYNDVEVSSYEPPKYATPQEEFQAFLDSSNPFSKPGFADEMLEYAMKNNREGFFNGF
ncbi:hypothetical protein CPIN18021_0327 [Campylobacter pinnipediorum subsp. caledonicus]|uniref:Uncharacterized protein n=1 Tax=Campylobacter pinnipediorum subsp. caledonicus TaxID=1874362 RepID=A0A1S6U5Z9_9BACT|nr:hypothetical protein [Campylobacter pinnipediorum]AQW85570.1 hypothetical protein CPIN18020_0329 [Campylobacter pinnipediorum subsp. caledonicus]AQW87174.1 hypothetical protein CPIN18021_0327 [Campylobacter pinnipediorum subsp. caledonicus]OPA71851.1 hypothetical protein BB381_06865 [Campylobacter pinnipediorum subsp. caledonicus]